MTTNTPNTQTAPAAVAAETSPVDTVDTEELITSHMALVGHIVRETMGRLPGHINRDDLTSAGLTALVQAAQAFDADRGVTFARYAATRIRGAILDELRGVDWASRSVRRRARQLDETRTQLANKLGRMPSDQEVATALGLSVDEVGANDDDVNRAVVMSLQGFGDTTVEDLLPTRGPGPEDMLEHREQLGYLVDAVAELPERLRTVVEGYFFAERSMADIAEELDVTESRVSQMRAEALVLLRDAMNSALNPGLVSVPSRPEGCAARRREAYFTAVATRRSVHARLSMTPVLERTA